ncbi:MAG TPA: hypothetical protein VGM86_17645 [Thermoanaerobaculia bacterium]|jgi:hypothetical protein
MDKAKQWTARGTLLAGLFLVGIPVSAQVVPGGIDVWTTPDDGNTKVTRFVGNPLPADYFCKGSASFSQEIPLKGVTIATSDNGLGSTDTIVQRADATFDADGNAATKIQIKAISFQQHQPLAINCADGVHNFTLRVIRDQRSEAPTTDMTIHSDGTGTGGTFDATVVVPGQLVFTDTTTGTTFAPLYDTVNLQASGASWADNVGTGGVDHPDAVTIDSDGDGKPDLTLPGTSKGFHTGWSNRCNPRCPVVIQHQGPHPTWPVPPPPPCTRKVAQVASRQVTASDSLNATQVVSLTADQVDSTTPIEICKFTTADGTLAIVGNAVETAATKSKKTKH